MAMIFTETENIDDVIFFPLMRPTLGKDNAAIYNLAELPGVEPDRSDVVLGADELRQLVQEGVLRPESSRVLVRPIIQTWPQASSNGQWWASGHLELEGVLSGRRLRIVGFHTAGEHQVLPGRSAAAVGELAERFVGETLRPALEGSGVELVLQDPMILQQQEGM
jgi:hypothetical protein